MRSEAAIATKLLRAVLTKAALEFLVIILAIFLAAYSHLNPPIRGAIDVADATRIAGWAYDPREPTDPLEVQLFIDEQFVATRRADEMREGPLFAHGARARPPP